MSTAGPIRRTAALLAGILLVGVLLAASLLGRFWSEPEIPEPEPDVPPSQPAPRGSKERWWHRRHRNFSARARKGNVDVVFLGDSITQGWERNGKQVWAEIFEPLGAVNFGISGDQTSQLLWRISTGKELEPISPRLAVLLIGTNNLHEHSPEQIAGGVAAIVEELRRQKPRMKVLLLGIFPRTALPIDESATRAAPEQLDPRVKTTNALLARLADGKQVFWKDVGEKFLDREGGLEKAVMRDFLHLTPAGYRIWADAIRGDVVKLLE
jgi:lysophospholipase L1-like esterase